MVSSTGGISQQQPVTTTVRRHNTHGAVSSSVSTEGDMANATLPRVWADNDDKNRKKPAAAAQQLNLLGKCGSRAANTALGRRIFAPVVRSLWPCTPRKLLRAGITLCLAMLMLLVSLETVGRLRINGYFIVRERDNGLMGFYHEMDIDMSVLHDNSKHPQSKLYPASAINEREVRSWVVERQRRTNGRKYLVGCSSDWRGYVLRAFLHLFDDLKTNHGWDDLVTDDPLDFFYRQDPKKAPSVLFFCLNSFHYPFNLFLDHTKYFQDLRALGTLIVVWSDDLQYFDQFNGHVVQEKILKKTDVLMGSYSYLTDDYFASATAELDARDLPILSWLPHSAGPDFIKAPLNDHPIDKILLSGKLGESWYPLRHWLGKFQQTHEGMMDLYKHSGYYVANNQSELYASYLRSYRVGVTTTLIHQFVVAKLFEIPATGALLLMNSDLVPLMEALGMRESEHFVAFDRRDPEPMLWWSLDKNNTAKVDAIRSAGMRHVRENHMVRHRALALDLFLTEGVVTYAYPATLRVKSPCPSVAIPSEAACEKSFQWNARYKCDLWFCGLRSFTGRM